MFRAVFCKNRAENALVSDWKGVSVINSILVICLGNICRSPMAEGLLQKRYPDKNIASAGLQDITAGWPADPSSVTVMKKHGIDISRHRARPLTPELLEKADLVLTMESRQSDSIRQRFPDYRGKIMRIGEFGDYDVPDPYAGNIDAFHESFELISKGLDGIDRHVIRPETGGKTAF